MQYYLITSMCYCNYSGVGTRIQVTTVKDKAGDAFVFTLKRVGAEGRLMAWHESHASHASHTSHYSSRY